MSGDYNNIIKVVVIDFTLSLKIPILNVNTILSPVSDGTILYLLLQNLDINKEDNISENLDTQLINETITGAIQTVEDEFDIVLENINFVPKINKQYILKFNYKFETSSYDKIIKFLYENNLEYIQNSFENNIDNFNIKVVVYNNTILDNNDL